MYGAARRLGAAPRRYSRAPPLLVDADRGFVEQTIDRGVAEEAAVEPGRRRLRRVEHPAQDVGIGERAAGPLQREQLEVAC